ncbi:hypothetical protein [Streptomyces clavuligerus]|uniref:Integral membrane protein n=1 Tax=Streptomyces clavuligerus TaxID=1901 RepID=B5GWL7_STRCL|nr:hypothetical protein [Streptomyces clavuligerus]ANW19348.1 hypothetical protein BB341_14525 [Streptomyces clavuligerus]AXU13951.1 hypothetical protein D1794_15140 [Streptomyces clavuligerus]EDY50713.1 integral membrane protein [Streptomyces clavuligerus]EFG07876.1 Integral membrane protein [Streptomyces clavuligerus]MBY6303921.1 hypothetical protein [Streptomyces clavuligerus]
MPRLRRLLPAVSAALIALLALLTPLSVLAVWAEREIGDTDGYVTAMAPLASDPAVRGAVAERITEEVAGPDGLGPLSDEVRGLVHDAVLSFAGTDAYRTAWNTVNRAAHTAVEQALTSDEGDTASIDLAPVSEQVKRQLSMEGVPFADQIPVMGARITVVESDSPAAVRLSFGALESAGLWLPLMTLLPAGAALLLAPDGRRALIGLGLALTAGGVLLRIAVTVGRMLTLDDLPPDVDRAAADAVFDALTSTPRTASWWLMGVGLTVAVYAWGPGRRPDQARAAIASMPATSSSSA